MMNERPPSDIPKLTEKETRDWHPDVQNEEVDGNRLPFSKTEANTLQEYIWQIRDMLGLRHWDIYLTAAPAAEDTNASIHPVYGRYVAGLSVNRNWYSYSGDVQRNTIVHELLHVMHNSQTEVIRTTAQTNAVWSTFERETELMVDHLASAIDVLFPYPPILEQASDH